MRVLGRKIATGWRLVRENLRRKAGLWPFWQARRGAIRNWWACWLASTSLAMEVLERRPGGRQRLARLTLVARFADGLRLRFSADKWRDLPSFVETYATYMAGVGTALRPGDVVIDVGAHIGTFSIPAAVQTPALRVLAFEPDPRNFAWLTANAALNALPAERFQAWPLAVYSHAGTFAFSVGGTSTTGALTETGFYKIRAGAEQLNLPATTLEAIFAEQGIDRCRLLKLDCEGSEYEILENAAPGLRAKIENMIIEAHPAPGRDPLALRAKLEGWGYQVSGKAHGNGCWDFFCRRAEA